MKERRKRRKEGVRKMRTLISSDYTAAFKSPIRKVTNQRLHLSPVVKIFSFD